MKTLWLGISLLSSLAAQAAQCPWLNQPAERLLVFDSSLSVDKSLTQKQVAEDLDCLKILIKNKYIAQDYYPNLNLSDKIDQKIQNSVGMRSLNLLETIRDIHAGITDVHLKFALYRTKTIRFFESKDNLVTINKDYPLDQIIEKSEYIYFKPGDLLDTLSESMESFVENVRTKNKNYILDIRGNGGGDDVFAQALTEAIFTTEEYVPKTKRIQVNSPFQRIGFCVSLSLMKYDSAKDFCKQTAEEVTGRLLAETLSFDYSSYEQVFIGKRPLKYSAQFFILIDSGCASSCETIIEKLSAHPNVKLIGTNSAGALHFSNAVTFMLPNSGIIAHIPTLFHKMENDAPEQIGYAPHTDTKFVNLDQLFQ